MVVGVQEGELAPLLAEHDEDGVHEVEHFAEVEDVHYHGHPLRVLVERVANRLVSLASVLRNGKVEHEAAQYALENVRTVKSKQEM